MLNVLMEYVTLDGRYTRVFKYHSILLNHFKHQVRVSLPFYLASSLNASLRNNRQNPTRHSILHEGLLMLIHDHLKAMQSLSHKTPSSKDRVVVKGKRKSSVSPQKKGKRKVLEDSSYEISGED